MNTSSFTACRSVWIECFSPAPFVCLFGVFMCVCVFPPQTDGLCSSDGVIIQTVTSDPASSDPLSQSQLVVETEEQSQDDDRLEATCVLEGSENVVTETQEPMTDDFTDKVNTCFYFENTSRLSCSFHVFRPCLCSCVRS